MTLIFKYSFFHSSVNIILQWEGERKERKITERGREREREEEEGKSKRCRQQRDRDRERERARKRKEGEGEKSTCMSFYLKLSDFLKSLNLNSCHLPQF